MVAQSTIDFKIGQDQSNLSLGRWNYNRLNKENILLGSKLASDIGLTMVYKLNESYIRPFAEIEFHMKKKIKHNCCY